MPKRPRRTVPPPPSTIFDYDPRSGKVLEGYILPEPLTAETWDRFFLAVRTMVGRKYPGLLSAWDDASYSLADCQIRDEAPQAIAEVLERLCTILERPEAAKPVKFYPHHKVMYEHTKAILRHCRKLSRRAGRLVQYEPLKGPWYVEPVLLPGDPSWPGPPVPKNSQAFYRVALQELYGDWKVPADVLEECVALADKPAQAAQAVVAAWAGLAPNYLAKRVYSHPRRRSRES